MNDARQRYIIVDGHSIVHAWMDLRCLHERDTRGAREELLKRMTVLHDTETEKVVVVFDGNGPKSAVSSRLQVMDVQVVYSGRGATADSIIERLVQHYATLYDITVATDDTGVKLAITAFGAWPLGAEMLRQKWEYACRSLRRSVSQPSSQQKGFRLEDGWKRD